MSHLCGDSEFLKIFQLHLFMCVLMCMKFIGQPARTSSLLLPCENQDQIWVVRFSGGECLYPWNHLANTAPLGFIVAVVVDGWWRWWFGWLVDLAGYLVVWLLVWLVG